MSHGDRLPPTEAVGWHPGVVVALFMAGALVFVGIPVLCCGHVIFFDQIFRPPQAVEESITTKAAREAKEPATREPPPAAAPDLPRGRHRHMLETSALVGRSVFPWTNKKA